MKKLTFYGHSDDCICIDVNGKGYDEFYVSEHGTAIHLKSAVGEQRIGVFAAYSSVKGFDGTWIFGLGLIEEDDEFPNWKVEYTKRHGYSVAMTIEVPDDTTFKPAEE